jgi:hypothetical protein
MFGLLLAGLLASSHAEAGSKPLKCPWKGEAVDAFTGKDARYMTVTYYYTYQLTFQHPADGNVAVELKFPELGMTENHVDKPLMFLLADSTILEMPLTETTPPLHTADGNGVRTIHTVNGTLSLDTWKKIHDVGVARIRFPNPQKEYTLELDSGDKKQFATFAECLTAQ